MLDAPEHDAPSKTRNKKVDKISWPADEVSRRSVSELIPYARNARTHSEAQVGQIAASIREWGWTTPVLISEDGGIIAGHGRVLAAQKLGIDEIPVMIARGWSDAQKRAYILADNQLALNAGWDSDLLKLELLELDELDFDIDLIGFDGDFLANMLNDPTEGLTDPDEVPETPEQPITKPGDVWILGRHKLLCGSSTEAAALEHMTGVDLVCTDPPYCSGGFQEAGKSVGSVGTSAKHKQIANDRLSTRGYQALIKSAVFSIDAQFFYVFTDWRMWTYLYDLAESSGAGVRSMITWNKGTPGMGLGWRSQHELVLWGCRKSPPYAKGFPGLGNVISLSRQKNDLHTTQKPVELMVTLLQGAPFARVVAEPFAGSGSTLIACEMEGRECRAVEMDTAYCDVIAKRWQDFTGQDATLEGDGRTFTEISDERK
jgi:DNA modification methylase